MKKSVFSKVIGTGGIGTGLLFVTDDDRTLGRNESRLVLQESARDYCKQHIVLYYTSVLLAGRAPVYPIGSVGKDAWGDSLLREMKQYGMNVDYVAQDDRLPTTISFCLQYPGKDGCNITASNGASGGVTPQRIRTAMDTIGVDTQTIVAAIPEVSVESRMEMLRYGSEKGAYCAVSVPEAEADVFLEGGAFRYTDLVALNEREAAALAPGEGGEADLARRLYEKLYALNSHISLIVTAGKHGAYTVQQGRLEYVPNLPVSAVNTAGAGDAFLGGTLAGLCMGLRLQKGHNDGSFGDTALESAAELGALCAGMSVESADSIAYSVNKPGITQRIRRDGLQMSAAFAEGLE